MQQGWDFENDDEDQTGIGRNFVGLTVTGKWRGQVASRVVSAYLAKDQVVCWGREGDSALPSMRFIWLSV